MKRIKICILSLLSFMAIPFMTSCFSDSTADNSHNILDPEETAEYLKKMKGTYVGRCYYSYLGKGESGALVMKEDSIKNVEWILHEDGILTISKLPVRLVSKALQGGSQFAYLSEELAACKDTTVEAKAVPFRTADNWNYPFAVYPKENVVLHVNKDGRDNKVVLYYQNLINIQGLYYEMSGLCKVHENQMFITLPIGSISVNDVQAGVQPSMFHYVGAKKHEEIEDKK